MATPRVTRAESEEILRQARRIAVLGIKPESRSGEPAHWIPAYLQQVGYEVIPVPTYYPELTEILGRPVIRDLTAVSPPVHVLDVFRRPEDFPAHLEDVLRLRPEVVWFQSGCLHAPSAARLAEAGIRVVHDCIYVVHQGMVG